MKISNWKNIDKGALKGSFDLTLVFDQGKFEFVVHECTLFEKDGRKWVSFPCRAYEKEGKTKYIPYVSLPSKEVKNKVEAECLRQLEAQIRAIPEPVKASSVTDDIPF
jgi:hypothetical protein